MALSLTPPAHPADTCLSWHVGHDVSPQRLDRYLAAYAIAGQIPALVHMSRTRLQRLIAAGRCWCNGQPVRAATHVVPGDRLCLQVPPAAPLALLPNPTPLHVLDEDAHLLVVNKPPKLVVHPGHGTRAPTLVHMLLAHCRDLSGVGGVLRPGIVHRLDAGTSGALVVAKNDAAHQHLAAQFAARQVGKVYLALVLGHVRHAAGVCDSFICRHPTARQRFVVHPRQGRRAITHYRVLARQYGLTFVELHPLTGRTHQLRVHMATLGHPIVGDPLYGRPWPLSARRLAPAGLVDLLINLDHQALHAWRLAFVDPYAPGAPVRRAVAPLPPSWRDAVGCDGGLPWPTHSLHGAHPHGMVSPSSPP